MENLAETRKRRNDVLDTSFDVNAPCSSKRRNSSDTIDFLIESAKRKEEDNKVHRKIREEKLRLEKDSLEFEKERFRVETDIRKQELGNQNNFNMNLLRTMQEDRQSAQQQNNQMLGLLANLLQTFQQNR